MSTTTPNLALPLLAAAQAQKHVTHNEALLLVDALLQCAVRDKDLAGPPGAPAEGERYIVAAAATGAWAGRSGMIALWDGAEWQFCAARPGFLAYVLDEALLYVSDGSRWASLTAALTSIQNLGLLGIGTAADATNPFAAKLNKALWTAKAAAEGGTGDLRYTLNKEGTSNTASLLFQSGYSGRLEFGLVGSDSPALKVSPDGATWRTALAIDAGTGGVDALASSSDLPSAATTDIGAAPTRKVNITGSTTVTSFGSLAHKERLIRFSGALTLTHNATTLALPGAASIATAAGDTAHATSDASGNWTVRSYARATGRALIGASRADLGLDATQAAAFAGLSVVSSPSPTVELFDSSGASNRKRFAIFVYAGQFGIQARNDDGSYRNNPITIDTSGNLQLTGSYAFTNDNTYSLGTASSRATNVYSFGTITTSDARLKTDVAPLSEAELAAARDLVAALGTFQFLDRIAQKGADKARHHAGLTVQRAIEIMQTHGLDPFRYSFVCHDTWEATPPRAGVPARAPLLDAAGNVVDPGQVEIPAEPGRPAGDSYSFDHDQLAMFMLRGLDSRLAALEATVR